MIFIMMKEDEGGSSSHPLGYCFAGPAPFPEGLTANHDNTCFDSLELCYLMESYNILSLLDLEFKTFYIL
jgi:hypothetical protein